MFNIHMKIIYYAFHYHLFIVYAYKKQKDIMSKIYSVLDVLFRTGQEKTSLYLIFKKNIALRMRMLKTYIYSLVYTKSIFSEYLRHFLEILVFFFI